MDTLFANAVAAGAESALIGDDRYQRMTEAETPAEALRIAGECGFGTESSTVSGALAQEEKKLVAFVREYSPSAALSAYLLAEYDFDNAEAFVKAAKLGIDVEPMLREEGLVEHAALKSLVAGEDADVPKEIASAVREANEAFELGTDGFTVASIFSRARFAYEARVVPYAFARFHTLKVDLVNIAVAVRADNYALAEKMIVKGGKLGERVLRELCEGNREQALRDLARTSYAPYAALAIDALASQRALVEYERACDGIILAALKEKRFALGGWLPFAYYVLSKINEIKNVRIILTGLSAGADKADLRRRLRESYEI